ncbi:MAG: metal-dependent hydrolase [candidate division NC10 bacterium]|nr:metal-dependent hydrolase [candidate division NC10 bacterium]
MDNMTHGLAAALVARAGFSQRMGWRATAALVIAGEFPDVDYALRLGGLPFFLEYHRGFTHSLLGAAVLALPLGWLFWKLSGGKRYWPWAGLCFLGILLHILLDLITSFGTMVLYPLTSTRYAWDLLFIIDPFLTGIILSSFLATYLLKNRSIVPARIGLALFAGYLLLAAFNHAQALSRTKAAALAEGHQVLKAAALPVPLSPFRWSGVVEAEEATYQTAFSILDQTPLTFVAYPRMNLNGPLKSAEDEESVHLFRWFARFPVTEVKGDGRLRVVEYFDLRFHVVPGRKPFLVRVVLDEEGRVVKSGFAGL